MFRLNFWSRPLLNNNNLSTGSCPLPGSGPVSSEHRPTPSGALDYTVSAAVASGSTGGGSFLPLSMAASPALMALASNGQQDGGHVAVAALALQAARAARSSAAATGAQRSDEMLADSKERSENTTPVSGGTGNHHHLNSSSHHAAFGSSAPFPFYRHGQSESSPSDLTPSSTLHPHHQHPHHHHHHPQQQQQQQQQLPQQHHLPPLFSHLHHTLLRSHLDSAAVQAAAAHIQHQARLGAAALFGQRLASAAAAMAAAASSSQHAASGGSTRNGYRSAFAPATGRKSSSSSSSACSRNTSIYHGSHQQQQHHHPKQHQPGHDLPTGAASSSRSRRYSGDERINSDDETASGDVIAQSPVGSRGNGLRRHLTTGSVRSQQRAGCSSPGQDDGEDGATRLHESGMLTGSPCSPQLSYDADSDLMSDHMSSMGDRVTPNMDRNASDFKGGHHRWSLTSEGGTNDIQCPVCRKLVHVDDLEHHLIQEFTELQQMYKSSILHDSAAGSSHLTEDLNDVRRPSSLRDVTSKSRYDTFMRIRNNRENRLAKIRSRRKRLHDEILLGQQHLQQHRPPLNGHRDSSANRLFFQQRDGNMDEDTVVDVIGFEEQEKENDWIKTRTVTPSNNNNNPTDCCDETGYKQMEDKSTKTDDVIVSVDNKSTDQHRGVVCAVCLQAFVDPLISVQCWHVHCERCWLSALSTKSSCPQCDVTTTSSTLQRIHI